MELLICMSIRSIQHKTYYHLYSYFIQTPSLNYHLFWQISFLKWIRKGSWHKGEMIPEHWRRYMPNQPGDDYLYHSFIPTEQQLPDPRKKAKRERYLKRRANPGMSFDDEYEQLSEESEYYSDHSFSDQEEGGQSARSSLSQAGEPYSDSESQIQHQQNHSPNKQTRRLHQSSTDGPIKEQPNMPIKLYNKQTTAEKKSQAVKKSTLSAEQQQQIAKLQLTYAFVLLVPGNYRYNCNPQILDLITSEEYFKSHTLQEMKKHIQALAIPQEILKGSIVELYHGYYQNTGEYEYISMPTLEEFKKKLDQIQAKCKE